MEKNLSLVSLVVCTGLLTLGSCGKSDKKTAPMVDMLEQQETQGVYKASLSGLNTDVAGATSGIVNFRIQGDEVEADVIVDGAPKLVMHRQNIRTGTVCPTAENDLNKDGFVDTAEADLISGKILIPLDSDINSQLSGGNYPVARSNGKYYYQEAASLTNMIADLYSPHENIDESYFKLEAGQELNLSGRVVIIHGIAESVNLPDTVAGIDNKSPQSLIPIACGVLTRVISTDPITDTDGGKN